MTGKSAGQNFHENRAKFDQKSSFNRYGSRVGRAQFRFLLAGNGPRVYGARRSERWWERAEGKQVVVVVGEGTEKSRHKKYSHGTVGSMSTVVQDLSRSSRWRHTTQRHRQQRWLRERPEENKLLLLFVKSDKQFCSQKNTATVQLGSCWSARHTHWRGPLLDYGGARKDQVRTQQISCSRLTCSYANQRQTALQQTELWTAETERLYKST